MAGCSRVIGPGLGGRSPDDAAREGEAAEPAGVHDVGIISVASLVVNAAKQQDAIVWQQRGAVPCPLQLLAYKQQRKLLSLPLWVPYIEPPAVLKY